MKAARATAEERAAAHDAATAECEALKAQYPDPFETLGVDILADPKVYSQLAHYMLHEYEKKGGGQLDDTTIMPYLRRLINAAKDRFKPGGSAEVLLFFTCVAVDLRTRGPALAGQACRATRPCFFSRCRLPLQVQLPGEVNI